MVVLRDDGVGAVVRVDRRRIVPAEGVGGQELPAGAELHQVALKIGVEGEGAVEDAAVRQHHRHGGRVVEHEAGAAPVLPRVDAGVSAGAAAAGRAVGRQSDVAAVGEPVGERGGPLRRQIGVDGDEIPLEKVEVRDGDDVDGAVRRDGRERSSGQPAGRRRSPSAARRRGSAATAARRSGSCRGTGRRLRARRASARRWWRFWPYCWARPSPGTRPAGSRPRACRGRS